ncbi:Sphingoid long-chain base transporter [Lachnellula subtilissima]|uniref:Sphingoid long-chain base transporter n=1 Tax=Lachnellula subtilissima TaxID=602034 RepID=A0A8H8UC93_9HELO|nr:Sphingoid long-chain base transporter [Lachnellula subtilissima]
MSGLYPNGTQILPVDCTLALCPLSEAHFTYIPTLYGNAVLAGIFAIYAVIQLFFGIRFKTWGYMIAMIIGLLLEAVGYLSRVRMHYNPFTKMPFILQLVGLTIGPAFLSAAIYLCLGRIIVIYGVHISRLRPRSYTLIFMGCDTISLLLQSAGGAIASGANTQKASDLGINIMIAGLVSQVISLSVFVILCADFAIQARRRWTEREAKHFELRQTFFWKAFLCGLVVATFTIYVRSCFRVAELWKGFHSSLANNEVIFMILEGGMLFIATTCQTIFHPHYAFQGRWTDANFGMGKQKPDRSRTSDGFELMDKSNPSSAGVLPRAY